MRPSAVCTPCGGGRTGTSGRPRGPSAGAAEERDVKGVTKLFGIPLANATEAEAVEEIVSLAKTRRPDGSPRRVATVNVDFVVNAVRCWPFRGIGELWEYLKSGVDFAVADGMPLVWLSRWVRQGKGLPERVTGADMMPDICRRCAEEGLSVYVLGGEMAVLMEAFSILRGTSPELRIAGLNTAQVQLEADHGTLIDHINASGADVLFLAMSHPKQEMWISRNAAKLDAGVVMGVGGAFNFYAGAVPRAPKWMQDHGLEWIHRISREPGRLWRRYAKGFVKFSWVSFWELARVWLGRGGRAPGAEKRDR